MSAPTDRLVAEALAKSGLLWVTSEAGSSPVWHVAVESVAYVVSGEGEQFMPEHSGVVEVVARSKESRARLISFRADASRVSPEDDDWERATFALRGGRLNAPAGDLVERWRESGIVTRLRPHLDSVMLRGEHLPAPQTDDASQPAHDEPTREATPERPRSAEAAERSARREYDRAERSDAAASPTETTTPSPEAGSGDNGGAAEGPADKVNE